MQQTMPYACTAERVTCKLSLSFVAHLFAEATSSRPFIYHPDSETNGGMAGSGYATSLKSV
eukprot:1140695-Pelagomonas_calceolata.AAC.6